MCMEEMDVLGVGREKTAFVPRLIIVQHLPIEEVHLLHATVHARQIAAGAPVAVACRRQRVMASS